MGESIVIADKIRTLFDFTASSLLSLIPEVMATHSADRLNIIFHTDSLFI